MEGRKNRRVNSIKRVIKNHAVHISSWDCDL